MIKGIIFDMDGTLVDSMEYWINSGMELVAEMILPKYPKFLSKDIAFIDVPKHLLTDIDDKKLLGEMYYRWNYEKMKKNYEFVQLKEGVKEFLDSCKSKGIKMSVATATTKDLTFDVLKRLGIDSYFEEIVTVDMGYKPKIFSDIYDHCLETLGFSKDEVLVFEDTFEPINTLKNSFYKVVGVNDKSSSFYQKKIKELVNYYIDTYKDLNIENLK